MSVVLKPFQEHDVEAIVEIVNDTVAKMIEAPGSRSKIALAQGTILLAAPTGSGKTLTIASALVRLRNGVPTQAVESRKIVWFWFAPFNDLVDQTVAAIRTESNLVVRDPYEDREIMTTETGDVFVSTWQNVAVQDAKRRKMRGETESVPSIDDFVERLREDGYIVGAVVDEAHHSFNAAPQTRAFYLDVLRPDVTIMATATPNDADLSEFTRFAGITSVNRLSVSREEVVRAGLNKVGVKAFYFKASEADEAFFDYNDIAIRAAVVRHGQVRDALAAAGIALTPLLLVQVENYQSSVDAARRMLMSAGIPEEAIGVHTAAQPDKNLRAIAYDERKQALIFKMSVATGFDAPRAWTLVSLRASRSSSFGLQVIGRIMRVHPRLQRRSLPEGSLLAYGHVFLANAEVQAGLRSAAEEIQAIVTEIKSVTDDVSVVEISGRRIALTDPAGGFTEILFPEDSRPSGAAQPPSERTVEQGEFAGALFEMVKDAESSLASDRDRRNAARSNFRYPLRTDIAYPKELDREEVPIAYDGLEECIAKRIRFGEDVLNLMFRAGGSVSVTEEDLFEGLSVEEKRRFDFSLEKVERAAQLAFRFNDSVDQRDLKKLLVQRLREEIARRDYTEPTEDVLRRTIEIALYRNADLLKDACKECMALAIEIRKADVIPGEVSSDSALEPASKGVYAVFGPRMNSWELRFAKQLDDDATGSVLWWIRNVENTGWACRIIRPNGRSFFPDFVIGIAGRKKPDHIALAEVKERIESEDSAEKIRVQHKTYGTALMVTLEGDRWEVVGYSEALGRNVVTKPFDITDFTLLQ